MILVDASHEQVGFFEFENAYGLGEALDKMEQVCAGAQQLDFLAAKEEIFRDYQLTDLLNS